MRCVGGLSSSSRAPSKERIKFLLLGNLNGTAQMKGRGIIKRGRQSQVPLLKVVVMAVALAAPDGGGG